MTASDQDPLGDLPWREPEAPRPEVSQCIRRQCTGGLCARRGLSAGQRVASSIALCALIVGVIFAMSVGHDHVPAGAWHSVLLGALGWGGIMLAVLLLGLARPPGSRLPRMARLVLAGVLPLAFLLYLANTASGSVPIAEFVRAGGASGAARCGMYSLLFGGLGTAAMLYIWRGTDPLTPGLSGSLAGFVGGLTGAMAIGCACPTGSNWHLWLGHGAAVLVSLVVGSALGRRWLSP